MKMICPVCGVEGFLQQRGNSRRIQHYIGYKSGKQIVTYHKLELNGSESVEVKTLKLNFKSRREAGPTGIEPATPGLKVRCSSLTELRTRSLFVEADRNRVGVF